jgi:4-hydroxy-tetrahydrodipicolinate synthase
VYPAWTRASFSSELLAQLAQLPQVRAFKIGTRDMNKYARDLKAIRAVAPEKALLTCHDEYLLASLVQGVDGALVGFASLVPDLIYELLEAVKVGDLHRAMAVQARIDPMKDAVYGAGEPTGEAHGRMKAAMAALGIIADGRVRPPTHAPSAEEMAAIHAAIEAAGLGQRAAA